MKFVSALSFFLVFLLSGTIIFGCTNYLVTKGASTDGSVFITYSADSHTLYGELVLIPAGYHIEGTMINIYEWDTGKYLGQIKQVARTYRVVGNMNEFQVAIGETTFGGREELRDEQGIIDYGSLMYLALQRARTAREAIKVMTDLVAEYGYYSSGESFSVSDPNEAWILEMIGKGKGNKGAVWVALRIPDGYVSAHANQSRIRQFPLNDPQNCLYAPDVISFARQKGYFQGKDSEFSFADAYAPIDFEAKRFCEARVWQFFNRVAPSKKIPANYVLGDKQAPHLPLWIKPDKKLSVRDLMELMRDHFEDTELDMTKDIGAGPYKLPYRWRPLTFKVDGKTYFNERAVSTQQTGFSFVAQSRSKLPNLVGGVFWFGVDDTYSTVYVPFYCAIEEIAPGWRVGDGDFSKFTWNSAFWTFSFVANFAYSRYCDMIKDIQVVQRELEGKFLAAQPEIETAALALYKQAPQLAIDYLTGYSKKVATETLERWRKLGEFLVWKYNDGNVRNELGKVTHPGYPESWYKQLVKETGSKFLVPEEEKKEH